MSVLGRFRRTYNPAVPLPWRDGRELPAGFTRPPSTAELSARRRAAKPEKLPLEPLPNVSPGDSPVVVVDDDTEANEAGVLDGEFNAGATDRSGGGGGLSSWLGALSSTGHGSSRATGGVGGGASSDRFVGVGSTVSQSSGWVGGGHVLGVGEAAVSVIGDIGGHRRCFDDVLARLGVVGTHVPRGLVIVQVGDLIGGRNGLNRYLLGRVDELMAHNPGQWVQLVGNWESRHIPGFTVFDARKDEEPLDAAGVGIIRRWWDEGLVQVAAAVKCGEREVLITHAGLTSWMWRDLGEPSSAGVAAELLNETAKYAPSFVGQTGEMCAPDRSSVQWHHRYERPGPFWASTSELWTSWHDEPVMPFDQIVGHTAPFYFNRDSWSPYLDGIAPEVLDRAVPSVATRHVAFRCGGGVIHSIDPQLHAAAAVSAVRTHDFGVAQRLR
jgi:hypothetical protein